MLTAIFYISKILFLGLSWIVLFAFDIETVDLGVFFISILIYSGSVIADMCDILRKANGPSKLIKSAKFLSVFLCVANLLVAILSGCFSKWLVLTKVDGIYRFKIAMVTLVEVLNISPELFSLKGFMFFVLICVGGTIVPTILLDVGEFFEKKTRKAMADMKKGEEES